MNNTQKLWVDIDSGTYTRQQPTAIATDTWTNQDWDVFDSMSDTQRGGFAYDYEWNAIDDSPSQWMTQHFPDDTFRKDELK